MYDKQLTRVIEHREKIWTAFAAGGTFVFPKTDDTENNDGQGDCGT
jgi:hypothetical protein